MFPRANQAAPLDRQDVTDGVNAPKPPVTNDVVGSTPAVRSISQQAANTGHWTPRNRRLEAAIRNVR